MPEQDLPNFERGPLEEILGDEDQKYSQPSRFGAHNLIIGISIALLVGVALMHTYRASTVKSSRTVSQLTSNIDTAMQTTKTAFAFQSNAEAAPNATLKTELPSERKERLAAEDAAIAEWRQLAAPDHPVSSRRLGLTLFMFGRKGGMKVLQGIGGSASQATNTGKQTNSAPESAEPITRNEERAAWKAIYGRITLAPNDVPQLKFSIEKMNLGWFTNIALEQLYMRAGMLRQASEAHEDAYRSAARAASADGIEVALFLLGTVMWMAAGLRSLVSRLFADRSTSIPAEPTHEPDQQSSLLFSYRARTTAFAVFLASYLFIRYPVRLLLPDTHLWSDSAQIRLSAMLQITLYVPVVSLALYTLGRLAASESPLLCRPRLSHILAALGLRSTRPIADIAYGIQCYVMVVPLYLITAFVSARLFHSVHTPINPVQLRAVSASTPIDQLLMLVETAIAVPIVEELMFRGLLFPALKSRWGYVGGVVLTSAIFGLLHPNLPAGFLPLWTLGAAFAVVFHRRQSLLPNIVMHALHNGFVTVMMFVVFAK